MVVWFTYRVKSLWIWWNQFHEWRHDSWKYVLAEFFFEIQRQLSGTVIYIYPVGIDDKNSSKEEEIEVGWKKNKSNSRPRLQWEASIRNICLLNITWIRRPQRVLRWLESFGRRKRRLLDMMARGPRTPEKWKIEEVFVLSDQRTRCDEAEHQAVVDEANPCFSFCDLANSSISSSCVSHSYFHHSSPLECGVNQLGNRFHTCLYPISKLVQKSE